MTSEHRFSTRTALQDALCAALVSAIEGAIASRGVALIGLSGGSTPLPLYRQLAQQALDWPRVVFALVDERWVPIDHPASNELALRVALAPALENGARLQGMKTSAAHASEGLIACEAAYAALPLPFDVVLLGMGEDGHIASLFPHAEGIDAALDPLGHNLCAPIRAARTAVTGEHTERMTLTLYALLGAGTRALLVLGEAKRRTLAEATAGTDITAMPVRALLGPGQPPLTVWWAPLETIT